MKYINATEVLPQALLQEIQKYICGEMVYIPSVSTQRSWGEKSGSKSYFDTRNKQIKQNYQAGSSIQQISEEFGLAYETVRKIIYIR